MCQRPAIIAPLTKAHQSGQNIARSIKPGKKQQGQYRIPSIQPGPVDGFSCQALGTALASELELEDEPDYDFELPDSALGPLR